MSIKQTIQAGMMAAGVALAGTAFGADDLNEGLIFYAPLDDGLEAVVAKGSPTPRSSRSVTLVEGWSGQGAALKGDAQLYYSGVENFNLTEGTVAFWARRDVPWGQRKSCVLFKAVAGPGWNRNAIYFMITDYNQFRVWVWDNDSKQVLWMTRPLPPTGDAWHHLAFTYRDGQVRIFLNGEEGSYEADGRGDPMSVMPSGRVQTIQFGTDYNHSFEGAYDELRIYDRVLTPESVRKLAAAVPEG